MRANTDRSTLLLPALKWRKSRSWSLSVPQTVICKIGVTLLLYLTKPVQRQVQWIAGMISLMMRPGHTQIIKMDQYLSPLTPVYLEEDLLYHHLLSLGVKSETSEWSQKDPVLTVPQEMQSLPCHQAPHVHIGYWVPNTDQFQCTGGQAGCAQPSWAPCSQASCHFGPWTPEVHSLWRVLQSYSHYQSSDLCLPPQKLLTPSADLIHFQWLLQKREKRLLPGSTNPASLA